MPTISKTLQPHINSAFPEHVCLVGSVLPNGYAQITPRGSTMVFDDNHIALWERGKGSTTAALHDGTKVTVYFRKPQLRADGVLPKGGIARFYGIAERSEVRPAGRRGVAQAGAAGEGPRSGQEGLRGADQGRARRGPGRDGAHPRLKRAPHAGCMHCRRRRVRPGAASVACLSQWIQVVCAAALGPASVPGRNPVATT